MKIKDISDSSSVIDLSKKKRFKVTKGKIILLIVIILAVVSVPLCKYLKIYFKYSKLKNRYVEPIISNKKMQRTFDDEDATMYAYSPEGEPYTFSITQSKYPYDISVLMTQVVDSTVFGYHNDLQNSIEYNLIYELTLDGDVSYSIRIDELHQLSTGEVDTARSTNVYFTPEFEFIEGTSYDRENKKMRSQQEIKSYYQAHLSDVKNRVEKMWNFFGKSNFKPQGKIVKHMRTDE